MRCDICLEESCNGKHNCDCAACSKKHECYRFLSATIRITNKCTQSCSHCCFSSSPNSSIFMSVDKAKQIAKFLTNNNVKRINIMGGEFFCNLNWYEILEVIVPSVTAARLVSNGDWANSNEVKQKLAKLFDYKHFRISLSNDNYHTNKNVELAKAWLESVDARFDVETETDITIVPVGRGDMHDSIYSMFACYCYNPAKKYSFLIDEEGEIYKCSFGVINYDNVKSYLNGGFASRFKIFNKKFYDLFVSSCSSCYSSACRHHAVVKK